MPQTTATATVLFTDLADSTQHRARLGEIEADRVFRDHEQQLRRVVVLHNGRVVKTAGDGIMAAFGSSSDAVGAAIAIQRTVEASDEALTVRIGVAAGDVSWDDDDCFGLPVVTAARLESAAEPGQILVSAIVRMMAGDRAAAEYTALEPLELKGLAAPVDVFSVSWRSDENPAGWNYPPTLPTAVRRPFVGRTSQLELLGDSWERAVDGGRAVVLVGGEAGAGKTRLVSEFAQRCHGSGAIVLSGMCDSDLSLPYQPWIVVLDQLLRQLPQSCLDELQADLECLSVLVPHIETMIPGSVRPEVGDPEAERHRLFSAVRSVLVAGTAFAPVLIIVDDLHWAGSQSVAMLRYLARSESIGRLMLVGTFRDTDDEIGEPLAIALAELRRVDATIRIKLEGLDEAAVLQLLSGPEMPAGRDLTQRARTITARTGGNPFFVWELCLHEDHDQRGAVPESVKEVVAERVRRLSPDERHVAELVAIASNRVDLAVLREATSDRVAEIGRPLGGLLRSGLVEELGGPMPSYRCMHGLIRDAIITSLPMLSRAGLHLAVATALEHVHEADRRMVLAELTHHFAAAAPIGGGDRAVYYGRRAAAQARRTAAYDEAIEVLRVTLDVVSAGSTDRAALLVDLVDLLQRSGHLRESIDFAADAYTSATHSGDLFLRAEAAIGYERGAHVAHIQSVRRTAVVMLTDVLASVEQEAGDRYEVVRARLLAALGRARSLVGEPDAHRQITQALADARRVADPEAVSLALEAATITATDPVEVLVLTEELEEITMRTGDVWRSMWATGNRIRALIDLGHIDDARAVLVRHTERAQAFRFLVFHFQCHVFESVLAQAQGRFADAETQIMAANEVGFGDDLFAANGIFGLNMFMIRREQGRLDEMRPVLDLLRTSQSKEGVWGPGLLLAYAELGLVDEALTLLDQLGPPSFSSIARDSLWPVALAFLAESCIALDAAARVGDLAAELDAYAGRTLTAGFSACAGPADRLRAGIAELEARYDDADRCLESALQLAQRSESPVWEARTEYTWASVLARRGLGEPSRAHFARASTIAESVGMSSISGSAPTIRTLRQGATSPPVADTARYGITEREMEVLALLATGCSNRTIADRLFISPNTAANHVRSILQKTGSANRTEAATFAMRNDLVARRPSEPDVPA